MWRFGDDETQLVLIQFTMLVIKHTKNLLTPVFFVNTDLSHYIIFVIGKRLAFHSSVSRCRNIVSRSGTHSSFFN